MPSPPTTPRPRPAMATPLLLVAALLTLRIVWLFYFSDLTLSEDEAHYWAWSQHPDWSYATKPPGVAWLIHLSTALLGHTEAAVRLPAALCMAVATLGAAAAARWSFPDRPRLPLIAAVLFLCVPAFAVASVLMTIDAPLIACWMWGVAFAARALLRSHAPSWLALGGCVALGLLFKHTMLLLPLGVALAAWTTRRDRPTLPWRSIATASALATLGLLPNILWNAANAWPTLHHLLDHLGLPTADPTRDQPRPWSPRFIAEYVALLLPTLGAIIPLALLTLRPARDSSALRLHFALAIPILLLYLLVSLRTRVEGNWPIAAACSLIVPAAWCVDEGWRRRALLPRLLWWVACTTGLLVTTAPAMLGFLSTRRVFGQHIPIERVSGMREHAAAAREQLERLRDATGLEPFILADHYGRVSLLMFYLPDTQTLSASVPLGGRPSQLDLWPHTNPADPRTHADLLGRPALLFGPRTARWAAVFETVEEIGPLASEPKPESRTTYAATGYIGFATQGD